MGRATAIFFAPPPVELGRGQRVEYHLIPFTKSISKILIPNFVRVPTNERYITYQMGFSFCRRGHDLRLELVGAKGSKIKFRPSICPLCKFNQIWYVSYSHE